MNDAENDLAALVRAEVERQANPFQIMVVDSVQETGTVNLRWGDAILNGVAANVSYAPRNEGDVVLVLNHAAGWRVIDRIGGPVQIDVPQGIDLSFGPAAPPADFVPVNQIYMKDGAIYGQTGEGPGPGPGDPPLASKPKPVTISPSSTAAYRDGHRDGSRPAQGAWPTYPRAWSAIFLYGSRITAACAGKSVASMQIRIARTSKAHGVSGKVRPRLGLHAESSAPRSTPSLSDRFDGPGLGMGDAKWITIPTAQAQRLAAGTSRGLGIGAPSGQSNYLIGTDSSGELRITFNG